MNRRLALTALFSAAALALSACAAASNGGATGPATSGAGSGTGTPPTTSCTPDTLQTRTAGVLTIATDSPAFAPWFKHDDPTNGKGFESAVAYAVAKQLGYSAAKVKWVAAPFNSVIAPTPKKFDFDINEASITAKRAEAVDFSSGYYDVAQAVVALNTDKYASASSIADLHGAKLGAQQGTTSLDAITNVLKPGTTASEYPTNGLAVQALKNGQIDGLVVDLPTGLYIAGAELTDSTIIGQLPASGKPEQFGLVLDKGSPLTPCVSQAVDALRKAGTLSRLQQQWLAGTAGLPELK